MPDFQRLIDIKYLLDPRPTYNFEFTWPLVILFSIALVAGIVLSLNLLKKRFYWSGRIGQWLRWLGFIGLVLTFFRYQGIPFLSLRIYFYILALGFLAWLATIVRSFKLLTVKQIEEIKRQETYDKYLPRPKRKRV